MKKLTERTLKELYDLTERISEPEITPVLEGSCRIQGPVDESDHELQRMNSGKFPADKKTTFVNESLRPRVESGTCNVCSAPCSSCMHFNRTVSAMESKIECGFSGNTCGRKEPDSCSFIAVDGMPLYKSRICDDSQHATSETSNLLSASSSHDSYSENAESKSMLRASVTYDASEDVDMPPMVSSGETVEEDQLLPQKASVTAHGLFSSNSHTTSDLCRRISLSQYEEHRGLEYHGDNISCITGVRDANTAVGNCNVDLDKKDAACSSASNSSLLAKGIENVVEVEATDCFHGRENEESQSNCRWQTTCPKESLRKKSSGASSVNAAFSDKDHLAQFPVPKNNHFPKVQSPSSHTQNECLLHHNGDSKDLEGNSSSQLKVEPIECSMDNGESSLGPLAADGVDEQKPTTLSNNENNKAGQIRSSFSSGALKSDSCLETDNGIDSGFSFDEAMKCRTINEQFEKPSSLMDASDMQGPQVQPQPITEGVTSESDSGLDDVKVCDICGDAGREDRLAICSRCSDGAEHTYCMREMLDKVPEGDWLCEECKLKENTENKTADKSENISGTSKECKLKEDAENTKVDKSATVLGTSKECNPKVDTENKVVDKSEIVSGTSKPTFLNENSNNESTSNFKHLSKLETKGIDPDARGTSKGLQSPQTIAKRHADNLEVFSVTSKKGSETNGGSIETASPRKKSVLSREGSFKNKDTGKVTLGIMAPSCGDHSANSSQAFSRSQTVSGFNSSNVPAQVKSPRGPLSRSISFNNFNAKPKVKHLTENVPLKQKMTRKSAPNDTRKEGLVRTMSKSASFKSVSSGYSNIESASKTQFIHPSRAEGPRGLKQLKERNVIEKKNSSLLDRHPLSPPETGASIPLPKVDIKVAQHDGKLNSMLQSNVLSINKGSEIASDLGRNEVKKQSTFSSRSFGSASFSGKCNDEDQRPCQTPKKGARASYSAIDKLCNNVDTVLQRGVPQSAESTLRDDKTKDPTISSSLRQAVSGGNRILRCQRCNETGHATQFCSINILRISALKPSAERNLKDGTKKGNKWKDAVEATISKTRIQKHNRLPDQTEEVSLLRADSSCEVPSKDFLSGSSSSLRNMPFVEGITDGQEISRISDADLSKAAPVIDLEHQAVQPVEASCTSKEDDLTATLTVSDELNVKLLTQIFPNQASIIANPLRASAIPELESIWQGGFEVLRTGRRPVLSDGLQAHLSTCASPKVLEVATKFPCKVQLQEVSCFSSWPLQFHGISPKEDSIALFFFAQDVESYERSYSKLLENMLKNDLALRGSIDGVELLIFPSNKLPVNSQRWNRLFFLWGVFKERKTNCLYSIPGSQKKPCGSNLNIGPVVQELLLPLNSVVSISQKIDSIGNPEKELARCDRSTKVKALKSITCVDVWPTSSSEIEGKAAAQEPTLVQNSSIQTAPENRLPLEQASCSFPVRYSSRSMSQLPNFLDTIPESNFQTSTAQLCQEVNRDDTFLKKFGSDYAGRNVAEPPAHVHVNSALMTLSSASPSYSISSHCRQVTCVEGNRSEKNLREKDSLIKSKPTLDDDPRGNSTEMNHLSWESRPNRKRSHSCSTDTVSQASGQTLKSNGETMLWKEQTNCLAVEDGRTPKKMCYSGGYVPSSFRDEALSARSSSKVHPLLASFSGEQQHQDGARHETAMHESSGRSAERFFFPVDPVPVRSTKSDNLIHILSSDDEDTTESNAPDLELALWGEKKPPKPGIILPLLFPSSVSRNSSQDKPHGPTVDDEDDVSASLSLSLAIPVSEEQTAKPIPKTEQLLPERPHVNTSLLLFGGFTDT